MFSTQTAQTQRRDQPATRPQPTQVERSGGLDDDRALLQAMLADDEDAWREFNTRYSRLIYRCITRVTARFSAVVGPDDVREIYGMVCMGLLANDKRKLRSFEPGRGNKLGSWIGMLAIHTAYDFLRGVKREPKRGCLTEAEALSSELPDPYEVCVMRQRAGIVTSLLGRFSDKDREFITLYFGEGLEPEQIAERMGISVKTVYSKKHKIRSRLEALLAERKLAA
jgi:RNA polymerase sigma-70 factor (ECF subfamily)